MAELQTRVHELTTADLAGHVDAQKPPDGPKLGQRSTEPGDVRPCSLNRKWESSDHDGAPYRLGSWTSRAGPSKTLTSSSLR